MIPAQSHPIPPVLFLVFNRPDLARRVFARIREARPARLFIAADGPRPDHPDDVPACRETRLLAAQVDWPCEVKTLFRDANLGCRAAVSSAITWFFEHVEAGIILEDDCLPDLSFFPFCAELLEKYMHNDSVASISGDCFDPRRYRKGVSYSFSKYQHIWGWATWKRAWKHFDVNVTQTRNELCDASWHERFHKDKMVASYWHKIANDYHSGNINTWDYPWMFGCWVRCAHCIVPTTNLVANIGFDARGTHTKSAGHRLSDIALRPIVFPLSHPNVVERDRYLERWTEKHALGICPQRKTSYIWSRLLHVFTAVAGMKAKSNRRRFT